MPKPPPPILLKSFEVTRDWSDEGRIIAALVLRLGGSVTITNEELVAPISCIVDSISDGLIVKAS